MEVSEQTSLFDVKKTTKHAEKNIDVLNTTVNSITQETLDSLFTGYDTLHATIAVASIEMIPYLASKFKKCVLLIGDERSSSKGIKNVVESSIALSQAIGSIANENIEVLKNEYGHDSLIKKTIYDLVAENRLEISFVTPQQSHAKIYLLSNEENDDTKTIVGSANLSKNAWLYQNQYESLSVTEDEVAYDYYMGVFTKWLAKATPPIKPEAMDVTGISDVSKTPIYQQVLQEKETDILVVTDVPDSDKETNYYADKQSVKEFLDKNPELKFKKQGDSNDDSITLYSANKVLKQLKRVPRLIRSQQNKVNNTSNNVLPQLYVSPGLNLYNENGEMDLVFDDKNVVQDINFIIEYFKGFDQANGKASDIEALKEIYFAVMGYYLSSPFWSFFRHYAYNHSEYGIDIYSFPMVIILKSVSPSSGKTHFLNFLSHLCFTKKTGKMFKENSFTRSQINNLQSVLKGFPICFEDIESSRRNYLEEIIKQDNFIENNLSPLIVTTNKLSDFTPDIVKRSIILEIKNVRFSNKDVLTRSSISSISKKLTGDFYKAYLKKMQDEARILLDQFADEKVKYPDLLETSTQTIINLFEEYGFEVPDFMTKTKLLDLHNQSEKESHKKLINLFQTSPELFERDARRNILSVKFEQAYEANDFRKTFTNYLVEGNKGLIVKLRLNEIEKVTQFSFKKGIFAKLKESRYSST